MDVRALAKVTFFRLAAVAFPCLLFSIFSLAFAGEIKYDSGNRRDPFIPLVGPGGLMTMKFNPGDLNIEGIIYDPKGNGSLVLVNGEFYKEGQSVNNSTVMSILKDRVVFRQDAEEKILWLRDEVVPSDGLTSPRTGGANKKPAAPPIKPAAAKNPSEAG